MNVELKKYDDLGGFINRFQWIFAQIFHPARSIIRIMQVSYTKRSLRLVIGDRAAGFLGF